MAKKRRKPTKKQQQTKQKKEQIIIAVVALAIVVIAFLVFGSNPAEKAATVNSLPPEINTGMAKQKFDEGAFMLDVRTLEEWEEYHVDGATLIPLDELEARVSEVPIHQEVIVICNSGNRSQVGRDILLQAGHTNVTSIAGGIQGWISAGYPTVSGK